MKRLTYITVVILLTGVIKSYAQEGAFIRIYNEKGKKCCKGRLVSIADSSLSLLNGHDTVIVPVSTITTIKMKRGFGTATLNSALIGGGVFALLGAATADKDAFLGWGAGEGATVGFLGGAATGALVGLVIDAATKRPEYIINQSQDNWNKIKETLRVHSALAKANKD